MTIKCEQGDLVTLKKCFVDTILDAGLVLTTFSGKTIAVREEDIESIQPKPFQIGEMAFFETPWNLLMEVEIKGLDNVHEKAWVIDEAGQFRTLKIEHLRRKK